MSDDIAELPIVQRNPIIAAAYAEQMARAATRATTHETALQEIGRARGDVFLNISKLDGMSAESIARNPAFPHSAEMFSGPYAHAAAIRDAEAERGEPLPSYVTTVVLHPSGTWSELYLFRR